MLTVLYPVLGEAPPFGPDDVLGETAHLAPFEPDHSTISKLRGERPTVLLFQVPLVDHGTEVQDAKGALWNRSWTREDLAVAAGSSAAVTDYLGQLVEYADWMRHCRRHGEDAFHQTPWTAAGTVLSYRPDETVPERPLEVLTRSRDRLNRLEGPDEDRVLDFMWGYAAALAILAMGGLDGMAIRRELWEA